MIYKDFKGKKLSSLGMGCMRFPTCDSQIDLEKTEEIIDYAIKNGINYFDTAWGYHEGKSESTLGKFLKKYPRDSFYLASKFPGFDEDKMSRVEEIFEKQLERCQVEYFDFYLFHCVCESNIDMYLDSKYGVYDYLLKQKQNGRIKHLGFSSHANLDNLKRFLEAYSENMEFCQLQINYLDWEFQNAKEAVKIVSSYGIPVWVMEPVRGGKLANLNHVFEAKLREINPSRSNAQWALRFIQNLPEVVVTLSGMSNLEQVKENIKTFSTRELLTENEKEVLFEIGRRMTSKDTLPCTACRYCIEKCPQELNIPHIIELYNEHIYSDGGFVTTTEKAFDENKAPSDCLACGACETVCPQNIKISEMMKKFSEKLK